MNKIKIENTLLVDQQEHLVSEKADLIKQINTGWGIGDTHGGPSNLKYGFDNKIKALSKNKSWDVKEFFKSDYITTKDVDAWLCLAEIIK